MVRKFFVCGNWKMNVVNKASIDGIIDFLDKGPANPNTEVVVGSPSCYLMYVREKLPIDMFGVAAQNCYKTDKGAFTGELSPLMIKDCGCEWVILGHLERRFFFDEGLAFIGEKIEQALKSGLKVITCVGERLTDKEAGKTEEVCFTQLKAIAEKVTDWSKIVLAYEAYWAMEMGTSATPQQAQDVNAALRNWVRENVSSEVAEDLRIIYAGSVTPANCEDLAACPDIDGFLVGGASLKPDFVQIMNTNQQ